MTTYFSFIMSDREPFRTSVVLALAVLLGSLNSESTMADSAPPEHPGDVSQKDPLIADAGDPWGNQKLETYMLAELKGHTHWLNSATFSPDGTRIATGSEDGTARVWDASTGACVLVLKVPKARVTAAVFTPDGARIVTYSPDDTARVWDASTGKSLCVFGPEAYRRVSDYDRFAHLPTIKAIRSNAEGPIIVTSTWAVDPLSKDWVAATVWDGATQKPIAYLKGHTAQIQAAAFSSDGSRIVTASYDKTARVWEAATGASLAELKGHTKFLSWAAFSPDGSRIVTASADNTARVWDAVTGASQLELKGHAHAVFAAAFSPDGSRIVTRDQGGHLRVWDAKSGACIATPSGFNEPSSNLFSADGTRFVITIPDNKKTWLSGNGAQVCDASGGTKLVELRGHTAPVRFAAFSPDGTRVVTTSEDKTARVWVRREKP